MPELLLVPVLESESRARERSQRIPGPYQVSAWVRSPLAMDAFCRARDHAEMLLWTGRVVRIWGKGVSILCDRPLDNGQLLDIRLQSGTKWLTQNLEVEVTQSLTTLSDDWCIDCSFVRELTDKERSLLF